MSKETIAMRTTAKLTSAVLAAAVLFGLSGLASVANAAEPASGTVVTAQQDTQNPGIAIAPAQQSATAQGTVASLGNPGDEMNLQSTRGFEVINNTGRTFGVQTVFATGGWNTKVTKFLPEDSYPTAGKTILQPSGQQGDSLDVEVQAWSDWHGIVVVLYDIHNPSDKVTLYMTVGGFDRYMDQKSTFGSVVPQPSVGIWRINESTS